MMVSMQLRRYHAMMAFMRIGLLLPLLPTLPVFGIPCLGVGISLLSLLACLEGDEFIAYIHKDLQETQFHAKILCIRVARGSSGWHYETKLCAHSNKISFHLPACLSQVNPFNCQSVHSNELGTFIPLDVEGN